MRPVFTVLLPENWQRKSTAVALFHRRTRIASAAYAAFADEGACTPLENSSPCPQ